MLTRWLSFSILVGVLLAGSARAGAADPVYNPANGHWYELVRVPGQMSWSDARNAAQSLSYAGYPGHLVTVTSAAEEQFVVSTVLGPVSDNEWWWMGGYQDIAAPDYREPAGGWRWVTGEPWSYTDWGAGQPDNGSGIEHFLGYFQAKQWNDFTTSNPGIHGYVVEYEPPFSQSPAGSGQLALFPNLILGGQPALGQVSLARPAGAGGEVVTLTSSNSAAAVVPATVTVPAGAISATFVITTLPVPSSTPVVITAGCNFGSAAAALQVLPLPTPPPSAPATQNLLVNGSFEDPRVPNGNAIGGVTGSGLPGWRVTRGSIDLISGYWQPAPDGGRQSIDLVGTPGVATIEQTFPTEPGREYLLAGWMSHNWMIGEGRADVSLNGAFFVQLYHNLPATAQDMRWTPFSYRFRATATTTTLAIADVTGADNAHGAALDGLSVTPASGPNPPVVNPAGGLAAPSDLSASMLTSARVRLAWSDNSAVETGFTLWRRGGGSDWTKLGVLPPNSATFTDAGVSPSVNYTYRVQAVTSTAASDWSNEASLTTPAAPAAPSGLTVTAAGGTRLALAWTIDPGNSTAVEVYRKGAGADWRLVAALAPGATSFVDGGLAPGASYSYRLRAANDYFASSWSNEATATTPAGL